MMKDFQKLMKQAQKMQSEMMEQHAHIESRTFEASAGGGMVVARVTGKMELEALTIRKEVIDPDDPEMLQDMVRAAVNEALRKVKGEMEQLQQSLQSQIKLPGMP